MSLQTSCEAGNGCLTLRHAPHPFMMERIDARMLAGGNIESLMAQGGIAPDIFGFMHVFIGGHYIPRKNWRHVYPHAGQVITLRMMPMGGGGGKNPLRTVLSLALIAAAPVIAGAVAGALGISAQATLMGISATRIITAGVNILGRLALNAIAPPGKARFGSGQKESPTLFLQGARNQVSPFGRVPRVLGRHRFVPPLGAMPYTETIGNDQYLRMIFVWGYGPLNISDLRIGETPLSEFSDVEVETRYGAPDDAPLSLYSNSVMQNDMELALKQSDGYVLRTTETEADEISVDLTMPRGLVAFNSKGGKGIAALEVEVQYSPAGENDWSAGGTSYKTIAAQTATLMARPSALSIAGRTFTARRTDYITLDAANGSLRIFTGTPFRIGYDSVEPASPIIPDGYIRLAQVERRSDDPDIIPAPRIVQEQAESIASGIFENSGSFAVTTSFNAGQLQIAEGGLRFAGFNLSAKQAAALRRTISFRVPRGRYDVRLRRITPDTDSDRIFNDTVWTALRTVRYAYPLRMTGLAVTALRIRATDQMNGIVDRFNGICESVLPDWDGTAWVPQPTSNPASLYRHVLQGHANARPLGDHRIDMQKLQSWHAACAAAAREYNGVIDYDASVREILQDIAAAGRASPTLSDGKWGVVEDKPQHVPVQHFSPRNTWGFQGRKAFDDVPDALRIRFINRDKDWRQDERLVFRDGITAETAQKYETITLPGITDPRQAWRDGRYHLASATLRPEIYTFNCDIEHIVCTRGDLIRFTHDVPMFGIAAARVTQLVPDTENEAQIAAIEIDNTVIMEADKNYSLRLRRCDGSSLLLALDGEEGETKKLVFASPQDAETAQIAVGDLALFGESGQESVALIVKAIEPQNDLAARLTCVDAAPAIHHADTGTIPPFSSQMSVPPELRRPPMPQILHMRTEIGGYDNEGNAQSRIILSLSAAAFPRPLVLRGEIRAKDESFFSPAEITPGNDGQAIIERLTEGETYDLRLRYVSDSGIFSPNLPIAGYRVDALGPDAPDAPSLSMNVVGSTAYLNWQETPNKAISHYTLRFAPVLTDAEWNSAVDVVARIPADTTSLTVPAAVGSFLLKAADLRGRQSEAPAVAVSTIAGLAGYNAVESRSAAPDFDGVHDGTQNIDGTLQLADGVTSGIFTFGDTIDLGTVYTSLVTIDLRAGGIDRAESCDDWPDNDLVENRDGSTDPSRWRLRLQLRSTPDDPAGTPVWSAWQDISLGEYAARAFQCRAILESDAENVTPVVTQMTLHVDMPDRTISVRGTSSDAAGNTVTFPHPFRTPPAIAITAQNMQSGDYYTLDSITEAGFFIRFFNAANTGISRDFDFLAKGYGEEN